MKSYLLIFALIIFSQPAYSKNRAALTSEILNHFKNKAASVDSIAKQMSIKSKEKKAKFNKLANTFKKEYMGSVQKILKTKSEKDLMVIVKTISHPTLSKFGNADHSEKMSKYMAGEVSKKVKAERFKKVKKLYRSTYFKKVIERTVGIQIKIISKHLPKAMVKQFADKFSKRLDNDGEYMMYGLVAHFNMKELSTLNTLFGQKNFNGFYKETTFTYMDQYEVFLQKVFKLIAP